MDQAGSFGELSEAIDERKLQILSVLDAESKPVSCLSLFANQIHA